MKFFRLGLLIALLAVSTGAFATTNTNFWEYFSVDTTCGSPDLSVQYLITLFGTVGNVLASTSSSSGSASSVCNGQLSTVFGSMFGIFNLIALGIGVSMISYTIILGIMNTAESGKFLGEKMSSIWIPIRTALGTAMLVPAGGTGYCVAQMLMMWFILNGVGAANTVWMYAVNNFSAGPVQAQQYGVTKSDMINSYSLLYGILQADLCARLEVNRPTSPGAVLPTTSPAYVSGAQGLTYNIIYTNSTTNSTSIDNTCGTIPFGKISSANFPQTGATGPNAAASAANDANYALEQYTVGLLPLPNLAITVPATGGQDVGSMSAASSILGSLLSTIVNPSNSVAPLPTGDALHNPTGWQSYVDASRTWAFQYANYIKWTLAKKLIDPKQAATTSQGSSTSATADIIKGGWLTAGQYYFSLIKLSGPSAVANSGYQIDSISSVIPSGTQVSIPQSVTTRADFVAAKASLGNLMGPLVNGTLPGPSLYGSDTTDFIQATGATPAIQSFSAGLTSLANHYNDNQLSGNPGASIMYDFTNSIANYANTNADPIYALVQTGSGMMQTAANAIVAIIVIAPVTGALLGFCAGVYEGLAPLMGLLATFIPVIYTVLGAIYVEGSILAVYLPMIPLLSFIVGGIGWLFAVIEAMSAAPIVAIALTIPEGQHEILGRAEPAFLMTLNVLLRPILMVVGFIMAIVLLRLALNLFNYGFVQFYVDGGIQTDTIFGYAIILAAYIATVITITQRVFGLITHLPDRVLSWMGEHGAGYGGAEQMLGETKAGVSGRAETMGRGGGELARGLTPTKAMARKKKGGSGAASEGLES